LLELPHLPGNPYRQANYGAVAIFFQQKSADSVRDEALQREGFLYATL
jgi:hypothetical protein